jgi:oligosaccharide repeat unit polymerase
MVYVKSTGNISILAIAEVRDTLVEDDGKKFGIYGLVQMIMAVYLILVSLSKTTFTFKHKLFVVLFLYYTMLLGSRSQFVYYFLSLLYILLWQKRINGKKIFVYVSLIFGLMYIITILRSAKASGQTLTETLMIYTITSMPAMHLATYTNPKYFGFYTFRVLYVWLNKFGFNFQLAPILSEYTMTPLPTNVYSYIKPYYMDFGLTGIFVIPLFLGIVHQYFYFKARRGSFLFLFLSSIMIYPLLIQVFDETYFRQLSNILYSFIIAAMVVKADIKFKKNDQIVKA